MNISKWILPDKRPNTTPIRSVISYCLWGTNEKYLTGMCRNIELAAKVYPGWYIAIEIGYDIVGSIVPRLNEVADANGVNLDITSNPRSNWTLMLDRFKPAYDYDVILSRDADSRLTMREKAAVDEWLISGKGVHVMHDHPQHSVPMLGGMWGYRRGAIPDFEKLLDEWSAEDRWQTDQEFLREKIWPLVKSDVINHAEFFTSIWPGRYFPTIREGYEFVGATIDENEQYIPEQVAELRKYIR